MRIALIGPRDREELVRLSIRLEERGSTAVLVDSREDPDIRMEPGSESAGGESFEAVRAVYVADLGVRSPWVRRDDGALDVVASGRALSSSRRHLAVWTAFLERLARRMPVVNPPATHDLHFLKPWETAVEGGLGLPVPATMSTSDPESLRLPPDSTSGSWIRKGMVGGVGYTESFEPPETAEAAVALLDEAGPAMIQDRIVGPNLRAFVLDGEILGAAEIVSRAGAETDSRRGATRMRRVPLPSEAEDNVLRAVAHWGMLFAAVDLMKDERTGEHVILECNSAPFFVNFEKHTGIDVSGRLAEGLKGLARRRAPGG